jgi:hypothetical protein
MGTIDNKDLATNLVGLIKNPAIKFATYVLIFMVMGIGLVWVLLGIFSPVLLFLLLLHWK